MCVTPGGSQDFSRLTSVALIHLRDLTHPELPDFVSHPGPIDLSHIQLVLTSGPLHWLFLLPGSPSPGFLLLPFFLSQPKCHFLKEAFPEHPRRHEVSPVLLYIYPLSGIRAWEGTSLLLGPEFDVLNMRGTYVIGLQDSRSSLCCGLLVKLHYNMICCLLMPLQV